MEKITLATLPQATAQQVFDQVAEHLLRQGKKSVHRESIACSCRYRGDEGTKCAAGCLISDQEYEPTLEYKSWSRLITARRVPKDHAMLITTLQLIHDKAPTDTWKEKLERLAEREGLNLKVFTNFD